jgi:cytoplasmic iron level regulating protein YaaA (DUF328/UPF0246 family)
MLILLPPSETKRDGGTLPPLELERLRFPELRPARRRAIDALHQLAADRDAAIRVLRLGPTQAGEVERNRRLLTSGMMPALQRYTGVLYDALDVDTLGEGPRSFADAHVVIQSALFGPIAALDPIPAYRLSFDSRLPGVALKKLWADDVRSVLERQSGLIIDLRSEGYAKLGPAPRRADSVFVRVVARAEDGTRRALNHFNKRGKGVFVRALLESGVDLPDVPALLAWGADEGIELNLRGDELDLVVDEVPAGDIAQHRK